MWKFSAAYMEDAARRPDIQRVKQRSYELLDIKNDSQVLDLGCGPGADTVALAKLIGPAGRVHGVDSDPDMIAAADAAALREQVTNGTSHQVALSTELPFPANAFSAVRSERLLQHLTPAQGAQTLDEAIRVSVPDGRIVFVDTDWFTISVHTMNSLLERKAASVLWRHFTCPGAARGLEELFMSRGLLEVRTEYFTLRPRRSDIEYLLAPAATAGIAAGVLTVYEWLEFLHEMRVQDRKQSFHATLNMVICAGVVPRPEDSTLKP